MQRKEYKLPNGKIVIFEYDIFGKGNITIESMDELMAMIIDRPKGEWIDVNGDRSLWRCDQCKDTACCKGNFCPNCGSDMRKGADNAL